MSKALFCGIPSAEISPVQPLHQQQSRWFRPIIAGLMAAIALVLALLASHEKLHLALHQDPSAHHPVTCAVCAVAQGQLDVPPVAVSEVIAGLSVSWTLSPFETALPQDADYSVASSCGPPASVSSL